MLSLNSIALLLIISTSIAIGKNTKPSDCSWTDPTYGVTFNYYALSLQSGGQIDYYSVTDSIRDGANAPNYEYYFNLCNPVLNYPATTAPCEHPSDGSFYTYCDSNKINRSTTPHTCEQDVSERIQINSKAYVYQVKGNDEECYPLSSSQSGSYSVSLYDDLDPTQGITIAYSNGAWADDCGANREFKVHLKCEDDPATVPRQTDVIEYAKCKYELTVYTMHGCPSGCPAYANSLCAAQGLCGYDFTTNRSRCFCYNAYYGSACERILPYIYGMIPSDTKTVHSGVNVETFTVQQPMTNPASGDIVNKDVNVTYDLTEAHSFNTVYQINDTAAAHLVDYQFYFNIGGTVDPALLPTECNKVTTPCLTLNNLSKCDDEYVLNTSMIEPNKIGYAYRYTNGGNNGNNECILLGIEMVKPWSLYDTQDNPAHGVKIEYKNGSYSMSDGVNCGIVINLICPDTRLSYIEPKTGIILSESEVIHHGECQYEASIETAFACPLNCITEASAKEKGKDNTFSVCSGRGMCIADPAVGFVRCICDETYTGDDCSRLLSTSSTTSSSKAHHSDAGFNVAIAIISILLIGVVIAVVYLYMRNKTLEKYSVPILEDHEVIEPRVPDYSDSDSDHFNNRPKIMGGRQHEMVTMTVSSQGNTKTKKQAKYRKQGKLKYQAQTLDFSDDDEDLSDENNGPNAYLAANQDDDSDTDGSD